MRRSTMAPTLVLATALLLGGWFLQQGVGQEQNVYFQSRIFQEVMDHVADRYVEPVDRSVLYQSAIDGVLDDLGDPNSSFMDSRSWENFRIRTEGEYGGVGLEIQDREGWVTVVSPIPGTPGSRAGIRAGDRLFEVDGESMEGWNVNQAVDALRGRPGSSVQLRVSRPGVPEPISFTLSREAIQLRSVPFAQMVEAGVGYVPLRIFSETSEQEVRQAIQELKGQGMEGLILDLRGNLGGLLDQGVAVTDLFLDSGTSVVETRGRSPDQNSTLRTSRPQTYPDLPLVVLIDETSASASEIVAGALQDHDRALVVGATSFGKGSVQTLFRLTGGNVLRLTTAHWYTPAGRSIQKPQELQMSLGERGVLSLTGQLVERPDTTGKERVTSMGGRPLLAGGGITPDLLVMPDTLSTGEQGAVRALYQEAGNFNAALANFSVRYLQRNPGLNQDFVLPEAALTEFQATLVESQVPVDDEVFDGAARFIRHQLEREIGKAEWGDPGEFRQAAREDRALRRAVELLREADTQASLFSLAGRDALRHGEAEGGGEDGEGVGDRVGAARPGDPTPPRAGRHQVGLRISG